MYKNVTEIMVEQRLDSLWKNYKGCKCIKCHDDIMTYALNRLPAQYVSTSKGELYNRAESLSIDYDVETTKILTMAMNIVETHPRHSAKQVEGSDSLKVFQEKNE